MCYGGVFGESVVFDLAYPASERWNAGERASRGHINETTNEGFPHTGSSAVREFCRVIKNDSSMCAKGYPPHLTLVTWLLIWRNSTIRRVARRRAICSII